MYIYVYIYIYIYIFIYICVCVCVCERAREREKEKEREHAPFRVISPALTGATPPPASARDSQDATGYESPVISYRLRALLQGLSMQGPHPENLPEERRGCCKRKIKLKSFQSVESSV